LNWNEGAKKGMVSTVDNKSNEYLNQKQNYNATFTKAIDTLDDRPFE
jgi:hypothetical protein